MSELKDVTPVLDESQQLWQSYLQKCCEYGQLTHALEQIDSQKRDIEKKVEITMREVKSFSNKFNESKKLANGAIPKPSAPVEQPTPTPIETH